LTKDEVEVAAKQLVNTVPAIARGVMIEPEHSEKFTILNFLVAGEPIKQADGSLVYGFVRPLGCARTVEEATEKAKCVIEVDSTARILIAETGRYAKLSKSATVTSETVDLDTSYEKNPYSEMAMKEKKEQKKKIVEIEERMKEVKDRADDDDVSAIEFYTKKARLLCALIDQEKQLKQQVIEKKEQMSRVAYAIKRLDGKFPLHKEGWIDEINRAYRSRGIAMVFAPPKDYELTLESFDFGELPVFNEDEVRGYLLPKLKSKALPEPIKTDTKGVGLPDPEKISEPVKISEDEGISEAKSGSS
jgi:hypothetical protein